ncbi:MAG: hypothetical protein WD187_02460 [Candidatus Woykebacteria bacterium]
MDEQKALSRGKYEMKKEELRELKDLLKTQAEEISENVEAASNFPTVAYIGRKSELLQDVLLFGANPTETHLDELSNKVNTFVEDVKKYQEINKEALSFAKEAGI